MEDACTFKTLFIFDFDDCVLPTSYLSEKEYMTINGMIGENVISTNDISNLDDISILSTHLFKECSKYGDVVIITNSQQGWVRKSTLKFLPSFFPVLESVNVLSAHAMSSHLSDDPGVWKNDTFSKYTFHNQYDHVISVGDSQHERQAVFNLPTGLRKSVKFIEKPTIFQLMSQLQCLIQNLSYVVKHTTDCDSYIHFSPFGIYLMYD